MTIREVIDEWAERPFSYGQDCCQFAGAVIEAITGRNPMDRFTYRNEAEALAIIAEHGSLFDAMQATLGEPYDGPFKDGDVTVHNMLNGQQIAGAVYCGESIVKTKTSVMNWPIEWAKAVWCT